MPLFPMFIDIKEKNCVIIGGGKVAYRKARALLEFRPKIKIVSPKFCNEMETLKNEKDMELVKRNFIKEDILEAYMVIAATNDKNVNTLVYEECMKNKIYVNVADQSDKCTFVFPSLVSRGELIIGITTSGLTPLLSKTIREKIENCVPQYFTDVLATYRVLREEIKERVVDPEEKYKALEVALFDLIERYSLEDQNLKQSIDNEINS